ncbi:hypothetical protein N781_16905 [Pontibacillus halophilus JSM 076056 = DSM 19796]|uniref:Uncharacterized protein n=1 Tax=Pontibacillus halophilus JSM 076056 = DSM 19796 TaxID=1385510 RepID=A0A0A5GK87_9BACI|nr:ribonuclease H-like YkuK family protein [Pontibacillus halophilus]KGX92414.1 hypothetical protein N781_16905 [Pontibacillus halophilus JSM 076056 = DSM 19796]
MFEPTIFYNQSQSHMTFEDVAQQIRMFIQENPATEYKLSIGTDSHVHRDYTRFITAIHVHRVGKGAWGCLRNYTIPRRVDSLKEKISTETWLSQEIAYQFSSGVLEELSEMLLPHEEDGANLSFEIHLDIGRKGLTKNLIADMTRRIDDMGVTVRIKPDSYAASSYANRYTK